MRILHSSQTRLTHCLAGMPHIVVVIVYRDSSLTDRVARGKPHPCLKAFGTSAGFSTTHG